MNFEISSLPQLTQQRYNTSLKSIYDKFPSYAEANGFDRLLKPSFTNFRDQYLSTETENDRPGYLKTLYFRTLEARIVSDPDLCSLSKELINTSFYNLVITNPEFNKTSCGRLEGEIFKIGQSLYELKVHYFETSLLIVQQFAIGRLK